MDPSEMCVWFYEFQVVNAPSYVTKETHRCHYIDKLLRGWFPLGSRNIFIEWVLKAAVETKYCEECVLVEFKHS